MSGTTDSFIWYVPSTLKNSLTAKYVYILVQNRENTVLVICRLIIGIISQLD